LRAGRGVAGGIVSRAGALHLAFDPLPYRIGLFRRLPALHQPIYRRQDRRSAGGPLVYGRGDRDGVADRILGGTRDIRQRAGMTESDLLLAARLADAAGAAIRPFFRKPFAMEAKADQSPVTEADRAAEAAMRAILAEERPDDGVIGEEYGRDRPDAKR